MASTMASRPDTSKLANRRVCVTGGAGFIGSHIVDALVELGCEVTVLDDFSNGRESNLAAVRDRIRLVRGSLLDPIAVQRATEDAAVIFHQAAITSVPRSVREPALYHEVNATGTLRLLEAARTLERCRVVYAASSSVYGEQGDDALAKVETMFPRPMSPYAAAKYAGEQLLRVYAHCYGLSCVSLRYFNIFGPRQRADSPYAAVIPRFADAMREARTLTIYGDGSQTRDFTHVANAVHANLLAATTDQPLAGEVVNVACGDARRLIDLIHDMAALLGVEPRYECVEPRMGDVKHSRASISAAQSLLGYKPVMSFEDGLADTLGVR